MQFTVIVPNIKISLNNSDNSITFIFYRVIL